jgi:hypothetical protein
MFVDMISSISKKKQNVFDCEVPRGGIDYLHQILVQMHSDAHELKFWFSVKQGALLQRT